MLKYENKKYFDGEKRVLTFDDFDNKYNQDNTIPSENFEEGGRLETFGPDLGSVQKLNEEKPRNIWSAIDGEYGLTFIPGMRRVNVVYYLISKEEWQSEEEFYVYENDLDEAIENQKS